MSLQSELEARAEVLRGILDDSNDALAGKGGDAVETLSDLPDAIRDLTAGEGDLVDAYVIPTGQEFTEYPDGAGFSSVTVAGDYNLVPQNIAAGVTIYGVEGTLTPGATGSVPPEYQPYVEHALLLYTGDYANMAILEGTNKLNVAFLMDDFTVLTYDDASTEFTAKGWLYCEYTKDAQTWRVVNYTTEASTGQNYVKHIRYSSAYWEYNGKVIWPVGMSGGGDEPGGGSSFVVSAIGGIPEYERGFAIFDWDINLETTVTETAD